MDTGRGMADPEDTQQSIPMHCRLRARFREWAAVGQLPCQQQVQAAAGLRVGGVQRAAGTGHVSRNRTTHTRLSTRLRHGHIPPRMAAYVPCTSLSIKSLRS